MYLYEDVFTHSSTDLKCTNTDFLTKYTNSLRCLLKLNIVGHVIDNLHRDNSFIVGVECDHIS